MLGCIRIYKSKLKYRNILIYFIAVAMPPL